MRRATALIEAELPDGTVLEFPDGTADDIVDRAVKSHLGASEAPASAPAAPEAPRQGYAAGAGQELLQGATFGFADEVQAVIAAATAAPFVSDKTFGQLMVDARNSLREDREQFTSENPKAAMALNVAGGLATGLPGAAKTVAGKAGAELVKAGAKTGAAAGAVAGAGFSDSQELISLDTALDTAIGAGAGAVLGAALPAAASKVSSALRGVLRKPTMVVIDDSGKFTDEAMAALDDLVKRGEVTTDDVNALVSSRLADDGVLTPEQAQRFNLFQSRGVTPTRANVTQTADDFSQQQSALKRTGPVAETVAKQDEQLIGLARTGAEKISPRATSLPETNAGVFRVVDDVVTQTDEKVGAAYRAAREAAKGQPRVGLDNLTKAISDNRGSENVSGGVISSLRGVLKNKGLLRSGSEIDINKRGPRLIERDLKRITVNEAEEIRQHLNSLYDSVSPQGRRIIRTLKDAIDDDVAGAVGDDIFAEARAAKSAFQKMIERGRRNKFDKTAGGFLEDVIDNKIPEEKIITRLLGGRDDDFAKFKSFLTEEAGEAGKQAWDDVRAQVLRGALDKATGTMAKGEGGQSVFNVRLFKNELARLQQSKKYTQLFNPDERKLIADIIEIGNLRLPVSSVQQGKGPTELAVNELRKAVLKRIPVVGERAQDLIDAVSNMKADRRLLDVTRETERALRK